MKGFKLLFALCLGLLAFQAPGATDSGDTVRVAVRRDATNNISVPKARQKTISQNPGQNTQKSTRGNAGRGTAVREKTNSSLSSRTTASTRTPVTNATTSGRTTVTRTVSERNQTQPTVLSRATKTQTAKSTVPRKTITRAATPVRSTGRFAGPKAATRISRAATMESGAIMANYSRCREVYSQCMDEFCANKDSQLKRCACSSRVHEFDGIKKQLAKVEDKMLDFNQRLLTVNMDAEDVDAMLTATEGENAFYDTEDKTKSKKMLDDITKKLNKAFDSDDGALGLSAISLSLDTDSVFDGVDSLMGVKTTTKTGTALYSAALPICREMALEICSEEEFSIVESSYQMQIEQDCNTVAKAYQTQTDQARTRVFESNALLDISRLDTYQKRNSDDILTCKKKMLDMLTDTTICGTDLGKCLDMTGQYIDPTTGSAFLTENLSELSNLLTRPDADQKWSTVPSNASFVTFLNKKKTLLEPATENCQDIASSVWNEFLEDALAKIKLAQDSKLEEIRQACTTLNTECLENATNSINEFDARALSVFGVAADRTANSMCNDVRSACTTLLDVSSTTQWGTGIHNIGTIKTFDTIVSSCTQVGRNCIVQSCRSMSSNFGLCEDVALSLNRHSILSMDSCWNEVLACVASADHDENDNTQTSTSQTLPKTVEIMKLKNTQNFYQEIYHSTSGVYNICQTECDGNQTWNDTSAKACAECRIAERIWGNCENNPLSYGTDNKIVEPADSYETLMSWFADNTNTKDRPDSCTLSRCSGVIVTFNNETICITGDEQARVTTDLRYCPFDMNNPDNSDNNIVMTISETETNCCYGLNNFIGTQNAGTGTGACCETGNIQDSDSGRVCLPENEANYNVLFSSTAGYKLVCVGDGELSGTQPPQATPYFPNGQIVQCQGTFIIITDDNEYTEPTRAENPNHTVETGTLYTPRNIYYGGSGTTCNQENDYCHSAPTQVNTDQQHSWFINYTTN